MPSFLLWLLSQARRIPVGWWHFFFDGGVFALLALACQFRRPTLIEIALVVLVVLHDFRGAVTALYNSPVAEDD